MGQPMTTDDLECGIEHAARLLGIPKTTLRERAMRGAVKAHRDEYSRWRFKVNDLLAYRHDLEAKDAEAQLEGAAERIKATQAAYAEWTTTTNYTTLHRRITQIYNAHRKAQGK